MLSRTVLAVLAVAAGVSANYQANQLMDQVLQEMRLHVTQNNLDPARVMPFQVKVKSTGLSNRDFKGNFSQGSLMGLSKMVRQGDCSYGSFGSSMKMGCYVSLMPVEALMNAEVKGDSISGSTHKISTRTTVPGKTFALVELIGQRFGTPTVDRVTANSVTMTTKVFQGSLDLNGSRLQEFSRQVNQQLATQLVQNLQGPYSVILNKVLISKRFP